MLLFPKAKPTVSSERTPWPSYNNSTWLVYDEPVKQASLDSLALPLSVVHLSLSTLAMPPLPIAAQGKGDPSFLTTLPCSLYLTKPSPISAESLGQFVIPN